MSDWLYQSLTAAAAVRTSAGVAAAAGVVVIAAAATKDENENDDPRAVAVAHIASHGSFPPFFALHPMLCEEGKNGSCQSAFLFLSAPHQRKRQHQQRENGGEREPGAQV